MKGSDLETGFVPSSLLGAIVFFGLLAILGWLLVRETLKIVLKPVLVFVALALLAVWVGILDGTILEEGLTWIGDKLIMGVSAVAEWAVGSYESATGSAPPSD